MEYYNYRLAEGDLGDGRRDDLFQERFDRNSLEVGNNFKLQDISLEDEARAWVDEYKYGIQITFAAHGITGGFDYFVFITALTQAIVMMGTAGGITSFWAMLESRLNICQSPIMFIRNMMGKKSIQYTNIVNERFNVLDMYAQFGVQAVV
eukprot:gene29736-37076_t